MPFVTGTSAILKTHPCSLRSDPERIEIEVEDEGEGFDPRVIPDPTQPEYIDRPHGRGIMLMRAYLDEVEYNHCG